MAKVLLNAFYLQSQGKLQNGPGYIRAGIEDGYDLLPQVASRLEVRRRELEDQLRVIDAQTQQTREAREQAAEEAAITLRARAAGPEELRPLHRAGASPASRADRPGAIHAIQSLRAQPRSTS